MNLREGRYAERFVMDILDRAGIPSVQNDSPSREDLSAWDLKAELDGTPFLLEVKFDRMAARTGNLAIEYFNPLQGRPSGIGKTRATFWVQVLGKPEAVWLAPVSKLRRHLERVPPLRDVKVGGDGNSAMKLYPSAEILRDVFHRIDDLDGQALRLLLSSFLTGEPSELEVLEAATTA